MSAIDELATELARLPGILKRFPHVTGGTNEWNAQGLPTETVAR